jgi:hypothetical protein
MKLIFEIIRAVIFIISFSLFNTDSKITKIILIILNLVAFLITITYLRIKSEESGYANQRVFYGSLFGSIFGIGIYTYLIFNP